MGLIFHLILANIHIYLPIIVGAMWIYVYVKIHSWKGWGRVYGLIGPVGLPFIGMLVKLNVDNDELFQRILCAISCRPCYEPVLGGKIGPYLYASIKTAEGAEVILSNTRHIQKSRDYNFMRPWLGEGLLISRGSKWFNRRKMLVPTFHQHILEDFMTTFNEQSQVLVNRVAAEVGSESFNILDYVTLCTLDIISETAMGKSINAQLNQDSEYVRAIRRLTYVIQQRQARFWLHPDCTFYLSYLRKEQDKCLDVIHGYSNTVIKEKKKEKVIKGDHHDEDDDEANSDCETNKKRLVFMDLLLEVSKGGTMLSDTDIREEVDTFMFAGHDTTAMSVSWCLYLLGTSPVHHAKVTEEVDSVFGDADRPVTTEDLSKMKYLDQCIKESLRLYPSVPIIARESVEDIDMMGEIIPKGTNMLIMPYVIHRDKTKYPNPEIFDPDNFLPERVHGRHRYSFIPFSGGPRSCIGQKYATMEQKVILATFLRHYEVEAVDKREDIVLQADLILRPKGGLHIKIKPRN